MALTKSGSIQDKGMFDHGTTYCNKSLFKLLFHNLILKIQQRGCGSSENIFREFRDYSI